MNQADRLSQIETLWTIVRRAHGGQHDAQNAQQELLNRYGSAIRRYLLRAVREEGIADDIYQEFATRFVRGDFSMATPEKGRFRTFLKSVLYRLVADHFRERQRRRTVPMDQQLFDPADRNAVQLSDQQFAEAWRDDILKRVWDALAAFEQESGKPWYTVMYLRVKHPEMRSAQLAEALASDLGRPITSANVRVLLHRAREHFSLLLIDAVADSLNSTSCDEIEEELADLRLLEYCRSALEQRRAAE